MSAWSETVRRVTTGIALAALSLLLFCWCNDRWSAAAWRVPLAYDGDELFSMALARILATGGPPWNLADEHLNAPFTAEINDFPLSEKLPLYLHAGLSRLLPPGVAANVVLWLAHATAVLGFFAAARLRGAGRGPAAAGGLLFGFSAFLLFRAQCHLGLAFAGHIPLLFVLVNRIMTAGPRTRADWGWGLLLAALYALMNPYFGLFLVFALAACGAVFVLRGQPRRILFPAALAFTFMAFFLLNQANYYLSVLRLGENPAAVYRTLAHLDLWGLRLPDLVWPVAHPLESWSRFAATHYFGMGAPLTESRSAFLGLAGLLAVGWMAVHAALALSRRQVEQIPVEAWIALLAVAIAVTGGLNYLLGSFGFVMLRGTNRYSVIILCAGLLHLARGPLTRRSQAGGWLAALLLLTQAWEMLPGRARATVNRLQSALIMASDQAFATTLEGALPRGAMVFQLPVADYPENGPIEDMGDYEHVRPFLWSHDLRFSYGTCKGRVREDWQRRAAARPTAEMVRELQSYGFSALYLNRRGFADRGVQLEQDVRALGLPVVAEAKRGDLIAYRLQPESTARLPRAEPSISAGSGFLLPPHAPATPDRLWACGDARLILQRGDANPPLFEFICRIVAEEERSVRVRFAGRVLESRAVRPGQPVLVRQFLRLERPVSSLYFDTSPGPALSPALGPYLVTFALRDLQVHALTNGVWAGSGFHLSEATADGQPFTWASRSDQAELVVVQEPGQAPATHVRLGLHGPQPQNIVIADHGVVKWSGSLPARQVTWVKIPLATRDAVQVLTLTSDQPPRRLSSEDDRMSAFAVYAPRLVCGTGAKL